MASSEENSSLFPIFVLSIMAIPLVPYTIMNLCRFASKKAKPIHCECSVCFRSGKYRKTIFQRVSNFSTWSNLTLVMLWVIMAALVYYIKHTSSENQVFDPYSILGLEPGVSDSEIKKAYRKLSVQYHPDKNPDPEANKYFVDFISKAYQALTDPISRENYEKYGHPDGRQVCAQKGPRPRYPRVWKTKKKIGTISKSVKLVECVKELSNVKEEVYGALDSFIAWELEFPLITVKKALKILENNNEWKRIIQVTKWMLSKGQGRTMGSYYTLLNALAEDGSVDEAEELWAKLFSENLESTPRMFFDKMVSIYYTRDMHDKMFEVFSLLFYFLSPKKMGHDIRIGL